MKTTTAANMPTTPNNKTIGDLWQEHGLNPKLLAKIRPVIEGNVEGGQGAQTYTPDPDEPTVAALLEEGAEFSIEAQYSTPFESSNPEGRMPNLMGMIQSGEMAAALFGSDIGKSLVNGIAEELEGLKGRSNFTKINSRQIYTHSASVRISGTLIFQAWSDAKGVEAAVQRLQMWASPKSLSKQSLLVGMSQEGITEGLFPSEVPPLVQLTYGGKTYTPLVIENVSAPITGPMTPDGSRIAVKCQISLVSLMAWDKSDIAALYR